MSLLTADELSMYLKNIYAHIIHFKDKSDYIIVKTIAGLVLENIDDLNKLMNNEDPRIRLTSLILERTDQKSLKEYPKSENHPFRIACTERYHDCVSINYFLENNIFEPNMIFDDDLSSLSLCVESGCYNCTCLIVGKDPKSLSKKYKNKDIIMYSFGNSNPSVGKFLYELRLSYIKQVYLKQVQNIEKNYKAKLDALRKSIQAEKEYISYIS